MSDIENENYNTDISNGDDQITDWKQEAAFYQNALEMALDYQRTLGQTISQLQEMSTRDQGEILDLQQTIERLKETNKKQKTQIATLKEKIALKDKSLQTSYRQEQDVRTELKKSQERALMFSKWLEEKYQIIDEQKSQIKLLQKILRQQKEDSSQS